MSKLNARREEDGVEEYLKNLLQIIGIYLLGAFYATNELPKKLENNEFIEDCLANYQDLLQTMKGEFSSYLISSIDLLSLSTELYIMLSDILHLDVINLPHLQIRTYASLLKITAATATA